MFVAKKILSLFIRSRHLSFPSYRSRHRNRPDTSLPFNKRAPIDLEDMTSELKRSFPRPAAEDIEKGRFRAERHKTALKVEGPREFKSAHKDHYKGAVNMKTAPIKHKDAFNGFIDDYDFPLVSQTNADYSASSSLRKLGPQTSEILRIPLDENDEVEFEIPQMLPNDFYSEEERLFLKEAKSKDNFIKELHYVKT